MRGRPQFGFFGLLLLTVVIAVTATAGRQFVLAVQRGSSPRAIFVIFTLAAPMIVVVLMSSLYQLVRWLGQRE